MDCGTKEITRLSNLVDELEKKLQTEKKENIKLRRELKEIKND